MAKTKRWFKYGKRHRDGDLPAKVYANGDAIWYKDGKCHRDGNLPAQVYADGYAMWFKGGMVHRAIGPATIHPALFFEYDFMRRLEAIRGETALARTFASWSPVLCFIFI